MSISKRSLLVLFAFGLVFVAAAPHFHRMHPQVRCDIPERDYRYGRFSQTLRSLSSDAIVFTSPVTADGKGTLIPQRLSLTASDRPQQTIKSFQFVKNSKLQIDHCSISQMSVLLHDSGRWTVGLRANQNPLNAPEPLNVTTIEPLRKFTDHLQRNEFRVVVRCYANHGPGREDALLGKPLVIPLVIRPFWVQKAQPYPLFETDYHPLIQEYFASIDRVEIEFAYQLD